ncbi:mannose-6-phosphate isomerase, class I [Leucobacter allii]|uniref:mannose-6-phosphate isomerase n=1 Tax=Leucobacter allii TaxID=2932247 RepID=A0ABY4FN65_9MICO|nr:mannose-6-phosphate isomerase, class I [Leucobacter allii]UOQ57723.1 mannose-6-phosphate isomerase, class I [Leucobacter allii]
MLIFIENTPRVYAWGSTDAIPELLGRAPTGEPQAELWLGTHPAAPAQLAKASARPRTLLDLVAGDPERYGVDGGPLPFLLKVLGIGAPLSLQVHPDRAQAAAGFAAEEAAGIPRDAPERNYGDANHKPELLVALSEVTALSGFRPLPEVREDLRRLAEAARVSGDGAGAAELVAVAARLAGEDAEAVRRAFLDWAFGDDHAVGLALAALARIATGAEPAGAGPPEDAAPSDRLAALAALVAAHPGDPGILVALLLHHVRLAPGEAVFLRARQLHAYLGGIAVEVMASSDNVLRAGLTRKHVDIAELCRIVDAGDLVEPRLPAERLGPGLVAWRPDVPDFQLLRARLCDPEREDPAPRAAHGAAEAAAEVELAAEHPVVLVVSEGRVRVERVGGDATGLAEVATARRGQSLYVSAGEPIRLSGHGDVFLATVGDGYAGASGDEYTEPRAEPRDP